MLSPQPNTYQIRYKHKLSTPARRRAHRIGDLITLPNQQLARRVIALSLRANELASAIQLSREHMANVRTEKTRTVRAEKQTAATRLAEQKRHFESVVQRHQVFIEQVRAD